MLEVTQDDVKALYDRSNIDRRVKLAHKLGQYIDAHICEDPQHDLAIELCFRLSEDANVVVRSQLANAIKRNPNIPKELAQRLVYDVEAVSLPILKFSSLIDDQDLIAIIERGNQNQQLAITQRSFVSSSVCKSLCVHGNYHVIHELLDNTHADLQADSYIFLAKKFNDNLIINKKISSRNDLDEKLIVRLISHASNHLKEELLKHHSLSQQTLEELLLQTSHDSFSDLSYRHQTQRNIAELIHILHEKAALSPNLIAKSLSLGDLDFFEHALAELVGIDVIAARTLIRDAGDKGFKALYMKAHMPQESFKVFERMVRRNYNLPDNRNQKTYH